MNTTRARITRAMGRTCEHTFIVSGSTPLRSVRPVVPDTHPITGMEITKNCPHPGCTRETIVPDMS